MATKETQKYGIPIDETIETTYMEDDIPLYVITRHPYLNERYLYEIKDSKGKKIETESNPNNFKALQNLKKLWDKKYSNQETEE